jgi:hypothetical protein
MPDLLAHALLAYAIGTVLSWRLEWLDRRYVTVVMVGAFVPDLTKGLLLVEEPTITATTGVPFSWGVFHTGGGVALAVLVGVVLAAVDQRKRVAVLLGVGATSHLLTDALLVTPSGRTKQLLWPLVQHRMPSPGLYLSTEPGPTIACGALALAVWTANRRRDAAEETTTTSKD